MAYLEDPISPMRGIFVEFLAVVEDEPERVVVPESQIPASPLFLPKFAFFDQRGSGSVNM
jgi:hypothetical protein